MITVSIRKRENETIIIQNFKRVFKHSLTTIIGIYCLLNFISIKVDVNLSYKFFLIWIFLAFLFIIRPALKREVIRLYIKVNSQKIIIKKQKIFGKEEENSFLLKDIKNMAIETEFIKGRRAGKVLVIKMSNNIEDRSISTADYVYDLRMIRRIILEYKAKGEEEWNF